MTTQNEMTIKQAIERIRVACEEILAIYGDGKAGWSLRNVVELIEKLAQ